MFTLSELTCLHEAKSSSKLLKPWWEVFMDCLLVLMLMVSVLAGTVLLSRDKVVCLPHADLSSNASGDDGSPAGGGVVPVVEVAPRVAGGPSSRPSTQRKREPLAYQQYAFISQVCYHEALPWYSRFFPYVALLQNLLLLASASFWFHLPLTSARLEHFLAILAKCCESPWTTRALSHAFLQGNRPACGKESEAEEGLEAERRVGSPPPAPGARHCSVDSGTDSPLLRRTESSVDVVPPSPCTSTPLCPSAISRTSATSCTSAASTASPSVAPWPSVLTERPRQVVPLGRSDGEQARALFERVRRFRAHCESSDVIYKVYLAQTVFKLLMATSIVCYSVPLLDSLSFSHTCRPEEDPLPGYSTFQCAHAPASLLHKLLLVYLVMTAVYGALNLYTLCWMSRSCLRQYSFSQPRERRALRDVPDLTNDLAFLLHMADQYDPLLAQRLSVFLSPVSESRLLEASLERRLGEAELRAMATVDAEGRVGLQLGALPRLPPALFSLGHLQVLGLELIADARLTPQVAGMTSLRELRLSHCTVAVDPGALGFLQERLETLRLTFTLPAEIPGWVYSLRGLHELHLRGRLRAEGRGWALGSLRQLRHLRVLVLTGALLPRLPGELCEVAGSLARLEVHNEGCRLLASAPLRRLVRLADLTLRDCQLEQLPAALLALTNLHTLDLGHNKLRSLEELLSLGQLRSLSGLRLAYNCVPVLPTGVAAMRGLELLDLANNQLRSLPTALFALRRLRRLLLAGNLLEELPPEVEALRLLAELDVSGNRLRALPAELFGGCSELRVLNAAHNSLGSLDPGVGRLRLLLRLDVRGNGLRALPAELGRCSGLRGGGLLAEDGLLRSWEPLSPSSPPPSRPKSDWFPCYSAAQWNFSSALESRI